MGFQPMRSDHDLQFTHQLKRSSSKRSAPLRVTATLNRKSSGTASGELGRFSWSSYRYWMPLGIGWKPMSQTRSHPSNCVTTLP